jgi:hypothetical protein
MCLPKLLVTKLSHLLIQPRSCDSSVSTVSEYRSDDRASGVRSPAEEKDFSSNLFVQTSSEAHQASYSLSTGGPFPGDADHSLPSSVKVKNE